MFNQPRASARGLKFKIMINKILKERATFHNKAINSAQAVIDNPDSAEWARSAAIENKAAARACLAELIIIENQLSTLKFLES